MSEFIGIVIVFFLSLIISTLVTYYLTKRKRGKNNPGQELRKPPSDITIDY